eukprot:356782-Chlamydomonas_euryale.AAC.4
MGRFRQLREMIRSPDMPPAKSRKSHAHYHTSFLGQRRSLWRRLCCADSAAAEAAGKRAYSRAPNHALADAGQASGSPGSGVLKGSEFRMFQAMAALLLKAVTQLTSPSKGSLEGDEGGGGGEAQGSVERRPHRKRPRPADGCSDGSGAASGAATGNGGGGAPVAVFALAALLSAVKVWRRALCV